MSGLTKLGFALLLSLSFSLLGLAAELLYLLHRRRLHRLRLCSSAPDPELGEPRDRPTTAELVLDVLCLRHQSRVEPATPPAAAPYPDTTAPPKTPPVDAAGEAGDKECDLALWRRVMCLGPSRALYTINEEEEEEECGDHDDKEEEEEVETPFATPCASPGFYTPSPSPPRTDGDDAGGGAIR